MIDTKFTPGSWHWREDKWNGGWSGLYSDDDTTVLVPQSRNDGDDGDAWFATVDDADEEGLADADRDLIAAAPDLYEALEIILADYWELSESVDNEAQMYAETVIDQSRAALAKARGKPQ